MIDKTPDGFEYACFHMFIMEEYKKKGAINGSGWQCSRYELFFGQMLGSAVSISDDLSCLLNSVNEIIF